MMDINEIREYLPHRYPFLLVDRVTELDIENKNIRAYKNVSVNEPFFNGHFPQHPIMPGVLIIEAMAQAAGILAFKMLDSKPSDGTLYYFVGSDKLRFRQPVFPGDKLVLEATFLSSKRRSGSLSARPPLMAKRYALPKSSVRNANYEFD